MSDLKYLIIVPDGCGDWPIPDLGGKTPMEAADMKNINSFAKAGEVGPAVRELGARGLLFTVTDPGRASLELLQKQGFISER